MSDCHLYQSLPKSVVDVADRMKFVHLKYRVNKESAEHVINKCVPALKSEGLGVKYYFLEDDFNKKLKENEQKAEKRKNAQKIDKLNSKQRKLLFNVNQKSNLQYETFEKINNIWNDYIGSILQNNPKDASLRLAKADYHGAKFCVVASCNPSLVGIVGIVVQETKNTFKLIDKQDKIRVIPKEGTLFTFGHNNSIYKLNGSHLKLSAHNRSKVKFKSKKISQNI